MIRTKVTTARFVPVPVSLPVRLLLVLSHHLIASPDFGACLADDGNGQRSAGATPGGNQTHAGARLLEKLILRLRALLLDLTADKNDTRVTD